MQTIQFHSKVEKRKHIAQETLDHFVPIAKELVLLKLADEFEKLSQAILALA